ncbi:MAG: MBL fold metallo-hydrolase [Spirochaetes bacterium]|nr:MBL fold metallo-hydrolase [Spirochaetota bacterium]
MARGIARMIGPLSLACAVAAVTAFAACSRAEEAPFVLRFIGHDSFAINSGGGKVVLVDPYGPGSVMSELRPFPVGFEADAVTVSHSHPDHNYVRGAAGDPTVIRVPGSWRFGDLKLTVLQGREGRPGGLSSSSNLICVFERDGAKVVHLGDSGIVVDSATLEAISDADAVIVSIDDYVISMERIMEFMGRIRARTVVPAHWEGADQLARFLGDEYTAGAPVERTGSEVVLAAGMPRRILVMTPLMAGE